MEDNRTLGRKAEDIAENFYCNRGFEVLERNYRYKRCEIDLIVANSTLLVFVEVKYRSGESFGNPEEFVSEKQKERILEAADDYIHGIKWQKAIRFDIIAINGKWKPEHFEDAFY